MTWNGRGWNRYRPNQPATSDDNRYLVNSYWILLTRDRDSLIVFVLPVPELVPVYQPLFEVGTEAL